MRTTVRPTAKPAKPRTAMTYGNASSIWWNAMAVAISIIISPIARSGQILVLRSPLRYGFGVGRSYYLDEKSRATTSFRLGERRGQFFGKAHPKEAMTESHRVERCESERLKKHYRERHLLAA